MLTKPPPIPLSLRRVWSSGAVLLAVLALAVYMAFPAFQRDLANWNSADYPSWKGTIPGTGSVGQPNCDVDTYLIHGGLLQAPTWRDTLRWWTGTWVGQVPFYRPLTSYVFWFQWRAWGDFEFRYHVVAILLHLLAVTALVILALALFRYFRLPFSELGALFTGAAFVTGAYILLDQAGVSALVFSVWKNEPDSLTLLFFSLTLTAYLHARKPDMRFPWRALPTLGYLLLLGTKEAGALLPLLLPILEWDSLRAGKADRRAAIHRMLPLFIALAVYLPYRAWCLKTVVGYQYGSNDSWWARLLLNVAGSVSADMVYLRWTSLGPALICVGVVLFFWRRQASQRGRGTRRETLLLSGIVLAAILLNAGVCAYIDGEGLDLAIGLLLLSDSENLVRIFANVGFLLLTGITFVRTRQFAVFAYTWALLALFLTLFSPSVPHRYYLVNAGFALLLGAGTAIWLSVLTIWGESAVYQRGLLAKRTTLPQPLPTESAGRGAINYPSDRPKAGG